jgi:hypothetical protein
MILHNPPIAVAFASPCGTMRFSLPRSPAMLRYAASLFVILTFCAAVFSQESEQGITIKGRVTDTDGKPIAGAVIIGKYHKDYCNTETNANGEYSVKLEKGTATGGIVQDSDGKPLASVTISFAAKGYEQYSVDFSSVAK